MNLSLSGRRALVCGGSQGIGLAIATELALLGASCTLVARNKSNLEAALQKLHVSEGQQHDLLEADFNDSSSAQKLVESVSARRINILINNTGGPAAGPITEATPEQFLQAFNQHLVMNHLLATSLVAGMKSDNYGRIINIISTSVKVPLKNLGVSNTIRGAVASWAKTMANELGPFGITVNNVLPGFARTQRLETLIQNTAKKGNVLVDLVEKNMREEVPLKRFGEPAEIAAMAAFLATPAAAYVNGASIPVDGGRTGSI